MAAAAPNVAPIASWPETLEIIPAPGARCESGTRLEVLVTRASADISRESPAPSSKSARALTGC